MTERQRQARELRAQGLSFSEIGARLGCTKQAAYYLCNSERRAQIRHPRKVIATGAAWVRHTLNQLEWREKQGVNVEGQGEARHVFLPDDADPREVLRVVRAG